MVLVIDASLALAWMLEEAESHRALPIREHVEQDGAIVLAHRPLEVANSLLIAERRKRIGRQDRVDALADLGKLTIDLDGDTARHDWQPTSRLA